MFLYNLSCCWEEKYMAIAHAIIQIWVIEKKTQKKEK